MAAMMETDEDAELAMLGSEEDDEQTLRSFLDALPRDATKRDAAVAALMKSKGLNTLDDLENDDGADFLYELQPHHNLVVIVEMVMGMAVVVLMMVVVEV